jgi:predicted MFS family arabinose efflux permease
MESGLVMMQTAVPLLAVRLGASWLMLGTIGWVAQAIRTPICFTSGHLSERVGRAKIIVPAALVCAAMTAALSQAHSNKTVIVLYAIALASLGAFYPPLQAKIGDVSERGQLRKNLGMFNVGWCVGGAVAAAIAGQLVGSGLSTLFYAGTGCCVMAAILVLTWRGKSVPHAQGSFPPYEGGTEGGGGEDFGALLFISRMGHFVGFFGFSVIRILFPKAGIASFGWSEVLVAKVVATFMWGLGAGILIANVSPWWRGKLWPQIASQCLMLLCAGGLALACSQVVLSTPVLAFFRSPFAIGALFFGYGLAQSISYTGALYYGLSSRKGKGTNTGIHETLVAAGSVSGCLLGGIAAQRIGATAPFILMASLAGMALVATGATWARQSRPVAS